MERFVYLAGGITGLTIEEAFQWRKYVADKLPSWLKPLSPLRGKEYLKDHTSNNVIQNAYPLKILSSAKGITCRDRNDVLRANALLVNFLKCPRVSIGTVMEIAWADLARVPTIVIMEKDNPHQHCMISESVGFVTDSLDEGIEVVIQLLREGI
jgi:hypothetical protein